MLEAVTVAVIAVKNGFDDLVEAQANLREKPPSCIKGRTCNTFEALNKHRRIGQDNP